MASQLQTAERKLIEYRVSEGIAVITLNDPPANTYSHEMMQQLDARILAARMDEGVQVIVITGSGEKFFCAGANIQMLAHVTSEFKYYFCLHANETLSRLEQTPKLVIAAINGHCVGGGLEVALAADIRIARQDAGKMGLPEVSLGVLPGTGGTQRLPRIIGKSKAIELMATGDIINAQEAYQLGMVNKVVPLAELDATVDGLAKRFAQAPRVAIAKIKAGLNQDAPTDLAAALDFEAVNQDACFHSPDFIEGVTAFLEKRKAVFGKDV